MNARTIRALVVLLPVLLGSQQAFAVEQHLRLRRILVMLYQESDAPLPGAGIIFTVIGDGPEPQRGAYIVTARHVITQGESETPLQVRFTDAYGREEQHLHKAEVLRDSLPDPLPGTAGERLTVLRVSLPQEELVELPSLLSCAKEKPSCVADQQSLGNTTDTAVMGFPSGDAWGTAFLSNSLHPGSELSEDLLRFQTHALSDEGYSGGVLATPQWDLLGIILRAEPGAQEAGVALSADRLIDILEDVEREVFASRELRYIRGEFFGVLEAGWGSEYALSKAVNASGLGLNAWDMALYLGKTLKPGAAVMGGVTVNYPQRLALEVGILEQHDSWELAMVGGIVARKGGPGMGLQVGLNKKIQKIQLGSWMGEFSVGCHLGADLLKSPAVIPRLWLSVGVAGSHLTAFSGGPRS